MHSLMNFPAHVLSLALLVTFGFSSAGSAPAIRISGSRTMLTLTRRLTEWYAARNPGVSFQVDGSNPAQGFSSLIEATSEITQSSRKALGGEILALRSRRKLEFAEIPVAT